MRRYIWVCTLFLVTAAAILAAELTKTYLVVRVTSPLTSAPVQAGKPPEPLTAKAPLQHYKMVTDRNIFNANPPPKNPPAAPEPAPTPAPVQDPIQPLQLRLVGTVAGGQNQRFAIFEDKTSAGAQTLYQVGDEVQQARIVDIRPDCVIFERNGQRDTLCFEAEGAAGKPGARQSNAAGQPPRATRGRPEAGPAQPATAAQLAAKDDVLRVDSSTWQVRRDLVLEQFANFGSLSEQAQAVPYASQGQQQGFRLAKLKAGSLLQQIGLQDGDVLRKVNDLELRSPQEALQAYQQLQNAGTLRLEILRRNQPTTLTYELR